MSYDVHLEIDTGGDEAVSVYDTNYTWNMGYAIAHGGIQMYDRGEEKNQGRFVLDGAEASAAATALADCIATIRRDAEALREREPDNGWGSVATCVQWLTEIMQACREHPRTRVRVS